MDIPQIPHGTHAMGYLRYYIVCIVVDIKQSEVVFVV